jgi:glutamate:Na+ symporter, ESS family
MFREQWFERGIFTWGWLTASVATGVALLRIVDPRLKSKTLEDFGMAYVGIAPVEIFLISTAPVLTNSGYGWALVAATLGFGVVTLIIARMVGWWSVAPPETEDEGAQADQEMAVP